MEECKPYDCAPHTSQTRELVMSTYNKANGYEADCDVIYGDTDSVMVNFGVGGNMCG